MFRNLLRTFKIVFIIITILICLPHSIFPSQSGQGSKDELGTYLKANESEKRLYEYKDNEEALKLKLTQLELINRSRRKNGAPEVKLDILASRVANRIAKEAAENEYISHWNMAGEKPYHRYAFAGGFDHVSENVFGEWTTGKYLKSPASIADLMKKGHLSFMAERPPSDGHRKTVINKSHNYVGIGYYLTDKQFRYYEEFIDRYFEFKEIPEKMVVNEINEIHFATDGKNFPYYLVIFRETNPIPLTPAQLNRKGSYSDYSDNVYLEMPPWEIAQYKNGFEYSIPLIFKNEGLYYIQIFADRKEIISPADVSTKNKTIASGIVIRVK